MMKPITLAISLLLICVGCYSGPTAEEIAKAQSNQAHEDAVKASNYDHEITDPKNCPNYEWKAMRGEGSDSKDRYWYLMDKRDAKVVARIRKYESSLEFTVGFDEYLTLADASKAALPKECK